MRQKIKLSNRIKEFRTGAGIGRAELAKAIGVTKSAIINWERLDCDSPSQESTIKLLSYFNCDFFDLFYFQNPLDK